MEDTKPIWASRAILGGVVVVASLIAGFFGFKVDDATQTVVIDQLEAVVLAVTTAVGAALAIWGRLKATKQVTITGKP